MMDWDDIRMVRIHARAAEARIAELEAELTEARNRILALEELVDVAAECDLDAALGPMTDEEK